MENRSVFNQDNGKTYLQITHQLSADILQTDYIEFQVMFLNDAKFNDATHLTDTDLLMKYDMFKCIVQNDIFAPGFWESSVEDWNVRADPADTSEEFYTYALDNVPSLATEGQDWFI